MDTRVSELAGQSFLMKPIGGVELVVCAMPEEAQPVSREVRISTWRLMMLFIMLINI
jgi:hypothetical protein